MFAPGLNVLLACGAPPIEACARLTDALAQHLDWPLLMDLADAQGMLPILSRALNQIVGTKAPLEFVATLRARAASKAIRSLTMAGELVRIMSVLERAGIAAVTFKGPTLAHLAYGDLALRDSTDLDICVPWEQISFALDILTTDGYQRKSAGFDVWLKGACEVALRRKNPDCEVDLHWQFSPPYFLPFDVRRAVERSVILQIRGIAVRTLCTEDLLLYLCIHAARECWAVRSICDVAGLLRNCVVDWDDLLQEATRAHCWRPLAVGLTLAADLLQAPVPSDVWHRVVHDRPAREIAEMVASNLCREGHHYGGAPEGALLHLRMIESTPSKARYLWRRAVQPNHLDADFLRLPRSCAALYYIVRPFRVACVALGRLRLS
jgi:Uncharacterised nucleotidyltransferase